MDMWPRRFTAWMNQDVMNPNESKKTAVMTRWICAVMMLYVIVQAVFMLFYGHYVYAALPSGLFIICFAAWYLTYSNHTRIALYLVILMISGWNMISTVLYSWNTGAQYGCGILLVYIFNCSCLTFHKKLLHMAGLMAACTAVFMFGITRSPLFLLSRSQTIFQELVNMLAAFIAIALITTVFASDTLDAERKLMDYNREMTYRAETDSLTGLMNRRAGERYFEEIRQRALREKLFVNVAMGDIDYFKKINDTYGHDAGDEVLKALSAIFQDFMKDKGAAFRWGGEEFLFVIIDMNGDDAYLEMERLSGLIGNMTIHAGDREIHVTMTFGIEECGKDQSMVEALEAADRKLYMGKARGRNQIMM